MKYATINRHLFMSEEFKAYFQEYFPSYHWKGIIIIQSQLLAKDVPYY